jgi:YD repeat-containing protein
MCSCTSPPSSCTFTDFSGFPVIYENPIMYSYQNFLLALFKHYSSQGNSNGQQIAPYILYARIGLSHGGENYAICAAQGPLQYCSGNSPNPCNLGGLNSTWPGPQGQFGPVNPAQGWQTSVAYSDAGYLTQWSIPDGGITGYITAMMQFLNAKATFPVTTASSYGPPGKSNQLYANLEAQLAEENDVGFGNEVVNIYDTVLAGSGMATFDNWFANFKNYPYAPVHHLQTSATYAAGFAISNITYSGTTATAYCSSGCENFCGALIFITGNPNPSLNGIYPTYSPAPCNGTSGEVAYTPLQAPSPPCGTSCGTATMWGNNYWPITLPFATQQHVTSVELWECDIDFAFGTTTTSGCNNALTSPNTDYMKAVSDTLRGLPSDTSIHSDSFGSIWQF